MASSANSYSIEIHPFISNSLAFSYLGPMEWPHQFLMSGAPRIQTPTNCNFPMWFHHFVLCDFIIKKKKNRESPLSIKNKTNLRGQYEEFHKLKKKKRKKYNSRTEKQKTHRLRKQISNSHDPISIERREKKSKRILFPFLSLFLLVEFCLSVCLSVCLLAALKVSEMRCCGPRFIHFPRWEEGWHVVGCGRWMENEIVTWRFLVRGIWYLHPPFTRSGRFVTKRKLLGGGLHVRFASSVEGLVRREDGWSCVRPSFLSILLFFYMWPPAVFDNC